jgi:hypothetical protein
VAIASVSTDHRRFLGPSNPVSHLLELLVPFLKPSIPRLRLSVAHSILHSGSACLPKSLTTKIIFLMGKKKPGLLKDLRKGKQTAASSEDAVSDAYLDWQSNFSENDVECLRNSYGIPETVTIRISGQHEGANPSSYNRETVV